MKKSKQTLIRVYTNESKCDLDSILETLSQNTEISGLTVFRGIAGFGPHHHLHTAHLLDLSTDLPLVIEFFHTAEGVDLMIEQIHELIEQAHIVNWEVNLSF
ncbi:MAG: DUF190 domain-containing protein [Gammaproteobacteria bacterium]|nr:DUF190 domain-containing protein [Gammaproteobacteria bacterium]